MKNLGQIDESKDIVTKEYVDNNSVSSEDIFLDATIEPNFPTISAASNIQSIETAMTNFASNNQLPSHVIVYAGEEGTMSGIVEQIADNGSQKIIQFMWALTEQGNQLGIITLELKYDNNVWQMNQLNIYSFASSFELPSNKVTTISSSSTDIQYPSAEAVYNYAAQKSLYSDTTINIGRKSSTTVGSRSTAEGYSTTASGNYSHAEGNNTIASGESSHVEGASNTASGLYSHAEGRNTIASSNSSHAEGNNTIASASSSHSEGYITVASGDYSHAEGKFTVSSGIGSHSEGGHRYNVTLKLTGEANATTYTTASTTDVKVGYYVEYNNIIRKITNIVEDTSVTLNQTLSSDTLSNVNTTVLTTVASGNYSHVEGNKNIASGDSSHAEGGDTIASGSYTHAEGYKTTASGYYSHAEGYGTVAQRKSQHVIGEYNAYDMTGGQTTHGKYLSIAGNGADESNRSNAYTLDWSGNGCFAGDVYVGATDKDNANAKKLATEEYVDNAIANAITSAIGGSY